MMTDALIGLVAVSLLAVIILTVRDHDLIGWPSTAIAAATWAAAPFLAYAKLDAIGLAKPLFMILLFGANLSVIGFTRGRPMIMMNQLFDSDESKYSPELRRRGRNAQFAYIGLGLIAVTIYSVFVD